MNAPIDQSGSRISAYACLTKPRIVVMVLVMTAAGYFLGAKSISPLSTFLLTMLGTALSSAGAAVLNNYLERDSDLKMHRTRKRPIPAGVITPSEALGFGLSLVLFGVALLAWQVNLLTGFLSLLTVFLYVLVYTPLKKVTWWNTVIGAIPGALPPMGGWTAATGQIDMGAWILFLILFLWQHPHFYAIAWMYKDDYKRGGFKMLPVVEPDGLSTFRQAVWFSVALLPISLLPSFVGMAGRVYMWGIAALGVAMVLYGVQLARTHSVRDAQRLLRFSIIYLPLFFLLILGDRAL